MYKSPNAGSTLTSINGQSLPLRSWVTNFHLLLVVIDPFSHESSWIINTASRVLSNFTGADCRVGWLVIGNAEEASTFLGPHSDEFITFVDPDGDFVKEVGLNTNTWSNSHKSSARTYCGCAGLESRGMESNRFRVSRSYAVVSTSNPS